MLLSYNKEAIYTIQSSTNCYCYKLLDEDPEQFNIIFNYNKCKFNLICFEFNTLITTKINADFILYSRIDKLNNEFKENIITIIVNSCSSIPIKVLSELTHETEKNVLQIVKNLILKQKLSYRIDNTINSIIEVNKSFEFETYNKVLEFNDKVYYSSINELLK